MPTVTIPQAFEIAIQHHRAGRLAEAEGIYRQILAHHPAHTDAMHLLGVIAHQAGQNEVALDSIRRAIALNPAVADYHGNLGVVLNAMGRLEGAIAAYRKAVEIHPDHAEAHNNLGGALRNAGRPDEAIVACRRALQINPDHVKAHHNLGTALRDVGRLDEAITAHRRAIQLQPDYADSHNNLGVALKDSGKFAEAIAEFRAVLQLKPGCAEAFNNLGCALMELNRLDEAVAAYRKAIEMSPGNAGIHGNLLLDLHYLPQLEAQASFQEHRRWAGIHAGPLANFITPFANDRTPNRRLRVGFLSPDFHEHSVAFFLEPLLASHDRGQVEIFCYANVVRADAFTARLQQHAGQWRNIVGIADSQVADLIRQDRIDILVDLAGHMARNRLLVFARKPAPVQATWLGYPDTTGMSAMDYRLTDALADPPGATEQFHSERLVRLPDVFACFRPADVSPPVGPLPATGNGGVTFASFHKLPKLNNRLLEWWAQILLQTPNSRLLLMAIGLDEISRQQRLIDFFGGRGIAPERLEFKGRQPLDRYLSSHNEVDLLLDSYPFSGHTISCHALWMGVPVVTLAGDRHCSRMVASVLTNLGLPDLIAHSPDGYVKIASELAANLPRLAELRSTLRERMRTSPLTDAPRFARNVEQAYREMWRSWCSS